MEQRDAALSHLHLGTRYTHPRGCHRVTYVTVYRGGTVELVSASSERKAELLRVYGGGLSFAICTNRPENLHNAASVARSIGSQDELIVVLDLPPDALRDALPDALLSPKVRLLQNPANKGLSYSRNRALAECANSTLVYVDDDVTFAAETVEAMRAARTAGSGIVGVLLVPEFGASRGGWWLSGGQYHYLGVHHRADQARPWGACMAVDARFANARGIRFREELGRRGRALQSGDDTSFLGELRAAGASESVLTDVRATHHISTDRVRLAYLLRRAWWQGRSEYRRGTFLRALAKEWRRNVGPGPAQAPGARRYALGALFVSSVIAGGLSEVVSAPPGRRSGG
ncbi:glycosyltransferase family 2 protein [Streptomyces polygonati]|uniref:Glycosyltransferase family 2 protein n=1 Tax=Streptomyces polygonati TaxID=1617087 RepID=A0ABV8HXI3_9ACTN